MSRWSTTTLVGLFVLLIGLWVALVVPVPLVALGPGPTYNTLGDDHGQPVVTVTGRPVYPTPGHLEMTTVRVSDGLTAVDALRAWTDADQELIPRAVVYPPDKGDEQVQKENTEDFNQSENDAEVAALSYLKQPLQVVVGPLTENAPAAGVLRPGDQLINVKGQDVTSPAQVSQILGTTHPGDEVPLSFRRGDGPVTPGTVKVGARPDGPQGFLGITPEGRPLDPNQIVIKLSDVGGPSAGLMFSLAVIDKISPADLAAGTFVAGTGTIYPTGLVGPISGITLKMIGARQAGATVFLSPAANCEEAASRVPDGMKLIKVTTLTDAVESLDNLKAGRPVPGC